MNELIMKLMAPYVPSSELFAVYGNSLPALDQAPDDEWVLRRFEVALLDAAGHGLNLTHDTGGEALLAEARYVYHPDEGATKQPAGRPGGAQTVAGQTLLCLGGARADCPEAQRREAKQLMRHLIDYHLQGKTVRTRHLFQYLEKQNAVK